jgi:PKD repeat protein
MFRRKYRCQGNLPALAAPDGPARARRSVLLLEPLEDRLLPANFIPATPLNDLGPGLYKGFEGGLYPTGSDVPPPTTESAALNIATNRILPLNSAGQIDLTNGKIVMISVSMSNGYDEFVRDPVNSFEERADRDPSKNPQLVIVDGAQPGKAVDSWVNPNSPVWTVVANNLAAAGVTTNQVEVAWVKQAEINPEQIGPFPSHALELKNDLEALTRNLLLHYPHIKIAYYSSRIYSYTTSLTAESPEPYAYESGFGVKWAIQDQIQGNGNLNWDPNQGTVVAPLMLWGPYLWADGIVARSDGLRWLIGDLQADLTHPSATGIHKVASQLLSFFKTDPTATPWFLRPDVGIGPTLIAVASPATGVAPLVVQFTATARAHGTAIEQYVWTFGDGDSSLWQNPVKTYPVVGTYDAWVTVTDSNGNTETLEVIVHVSSAGGTDVVRQLVSQANTPAWTPALDALVHSRRPGPGATSDMAQLTAEIEKLSPSGPLTPPSHARVLPRRAMDSGLLDHVTDWLIRMDETDRWVAWLLVRDEQFEAT